MLKRRQTCGDQRQRVQLCKGPEVGRAGVFREHREVVS